MREKAISEIPGIGQTIGSSMDDAGIKTAKQLYDVYSKDSLDALKAFVKSQGANKKQVKDAAGAIKEWDDQHN